VEFATVLEQESEVFTFPSPALGDSQNLHWFLACSIDYPGVQISCSEVIETCEVSTERETDIILALSQWSFQQILNLDKNVFYSTF
jgi:hypothetical protein